MKESSEDMSFEMEEIELYNNAKERQSYDDQSNLYAIIVATEHLERAYARDDISREEVSIITASIFWMDMILPTQNSYFYLLVHCGMQ